MNIAAIIQSRMTSQRYPGKMLSPFLGKPLLAHVVDRIKLSKINLQIILATSDNYTDEPLVLFAKHLGIHVVRGSLDDVVGRFALTLGKFECDAFFRVCGDSPLLLSSLFDKAVSIYKQGDYDLVTNVFPRTFPAGMSVELIKTRTFIEAEKKIKNKKDREHITQYFYDKKKDFRIHNIECNKTMDPYLNLALDKPDDLIKLEEWDQNRNEDYEELFPIAESK
jgi:spore coat polysaccharide biosynthesis protein SpsF (cytidylyltransferase family)